MRRERLPEHDQPTVVRVVLSGVVVVVVAIAVGVVAGFRYAPAAGWTAAAAVLVGWIWLVIAHMSPEQTRAHATREDPARALTDVVVLVASVASLAGVMYLLAAGSSGHGAGEAVAAGLGILSVAGAWAVVHTVFTLRYALLYYTGSPGGIDFNQSERPDYVDFAYLAFTLGMTYQVSDTDLQTRPSGRRRCVRVVVLPAGRGRTGDRHQPDRRIGQQLRRLGLRAPEDAVRSAARSTQRLSSITRLPGPGQDTMPRRRATRTIRQRTQPPSPIRGDLGGHGLICEAPGRVRDAAAVLAAAASRAAHRDRGRRGGVDRPT